MMKNPEWSVQVSYAEAPSGISALSIDVLAGGAPVAGFPSGASRGLFLPAPE